MNIDLRNISLNDKKRPQFKLVADWLPAIGFLPDSLVQFLPEPHGFTLTLCNTIPCYSELARSTRQQGGVLRHVITARPFVSPILNVSGTVMEQTGLQHDDKVLLRYEYGLIRANKAPDGLIKVVATPSRMTGKWLAGAGFVPGSVLLATPGKGLITCELQPNALARVPELVKHARANRLYLLQVANIMGDFGSASLDIPDACLARAGILPDDTLFVTLADGRLQLQKSAVGIGFLSI